MRFSALSLFRQSLNSHNGWPRHWRAAEPKKRYDVVIVGGGGHGLALAYYLASRHHITNVAVVEKGWIGGGNTGRNTAVIRSNYFYSPSAAFYARALKLYRNLGNELNYNVMFSPRGLVQLAHSRHELEKMRRWVNAMLLNGIKAEWLDMSDIARLIPALDLSQNVRFPVIGGFLHPEGGVARHDAVVWAYARAASNLGVDIIENCAVTAIDNSSGRVAAVETDKGRIDCGHVSLAVAGRSSELARMAGIDLPIESYALQAYVSEPIKPVLDVVAVSGTVHAYVSQSDKGEIVVGSGMDAYPSYAQRGSPSTIEHSVAALISLFPDFARLRMLRQWAGIIDVTSDRSPIMDRTELDGLSISTGWGSGGFKAIPAGGEAMADLIASGRPNSLIAPFGLRRFSEGALIDESAAASVAH